MLFDVGIVAVTMDLAEHHMFCGGSDGSIFQVDLCTWVSGGRLGPGLEAWVGGHQGRPPKALGLSTVPPPVQVLGPLGLRCHGVPLVTGPSVPAARAEREELPAGPGQWEGVQRPQVRGLTGSMGRARLARGPGVIRAALSWPAAPGAR